MKLLYSCLSNSWGGMEMYTLVSIKQLLKKNFSVELLCIKDSRIHIEANNIGIIIHPVKASGYFHPSAVLKTSSIIKRNKYTTIHTQASKDLWILVPALSIARMKTPLFLTKQVGSGILKKDFLHKLLYKRVNRLFAISSVIEKNILETCPIEPEKISIMPNSVDSFQFNPEVVDSEKVRNEFNIKPGEIVLGMLARFTPGKGHEEFLRAAHDLNKEYNDLKFLVVGEASRGEENYMKEIKKLAEEYTLHNIIFTGFRSDTAAVLAAMDIFVFPSHSEAFGIALIEAMAMKTASVCSNSDGVLDIAVDNETSLLFKKADYTDLKEKLKILIDSKELREKFGKNARARVVENFDLEKVMKKTVEFYYKELQMLN
ncbi:MAG: glycosyltransferase family 4 protein [Ignavibacteria bacterium]|nr:glycosyltransferase family 4 protein [Ignavibacteria bacterium]MBT8382008.1 glycosyltransferase family 4 protein [Ignavibacteria bacterium]NNL20172.1 glycosyltransferase family 4 protein [Ignavibacteriaceae bacterium]